MEIFYPSESFMSYDSVPMVERYLEYFEVGTRVLDLNSKETEAVEYGLNDILKIYREALFLISVPEEKNDVCNKKIGATKVKVPCTKTRSAIYRIVLEVAYPNNLPKQLQNQINNCAKSSSDVAAGVLASAITDSTAQTPIEIYKKLTPYIPATLKSFSQSFTQCSKGNPAIAAILNKIRLTIREEKDVSPWTVEE